MVRDDIRAEVAAIVRLDELERCDPQMHRFIAKLYAQQTDKTW